MMDDELAHWRTRAVCAYRSDEERVAAVGGWLDELGPPVGPSGRPETARWYLVDGPEVGGLNLVVREEEPPEIMGPPPALLDPAWYPGGATPACLPALLSTLTWDVVTTPRPREVVAAIFAALVPPVEQPLLIERAAGWLERVADRIGAPPSSPPPGPRVEPAAETVVRLAPYGPLLEAHAAAVAGRAGASMAEVRDQIVARVAHATSVLARQWPGDLRGEAAMVRGLLDPSSG